MAKHLRVRFRMRYGTCQGKVDHGNRSFFSVTVNEGSDDVQMSVVLFPTDRFFGFKRQDHRVWPIPKDAPPEKEWPKFNDPIVGIWEYKPTGVKGIDDGVEVTPAGWGQAADLNGACRHKPETPRKAAKA